MLRITKGVYPSPKQWEMVVKGMRSAYKSYNIYDSKLIVISRDFEREDQYWVNGKCINPDDEPITDEQFESIYDDWKYTSEFVEFQEFIIGKQDRELMKRLCRAQGGEPSHSKFLRQLPVIFRIKAPLYFYKQLDTYKIGTTATSESSMHTLTKHPFTIDDFSFDHLDLITEDEVQKNITYCYSPKEFWHPGRWLNEKTIDFKEFYEIQLIGLLNALRRAYLKTNDKKYWNLLNESLPQSYIQARTWSANYEVLRTIVRQRFGHKLIEWLAFIRYIWYRVPMAQQLIFDDWEEKYENFYQWGLAHTPEKDREEFEKTYMGQNWNEVTAHDWEEDYE